MRIQQLRKQKGITQAEVAKALGIPNTTYQGYECETSKPSLKTLIKIADYYGVSLDYLFGHDNPNQIYIGLLSNTQQKIISKIQNMSNLQLLQTQAYIYGLMEK